MSPSHSESSMPGLRDDAPQGPQPKAEEPNEETRRQVDRFFLFHDFDKDPLFNCPHGTDPEIGRNLVLCIDGTLNQVETKSSNVVETYRRLIKLAGVQHAFYTSGIGTCAKAKSWQESVYHAINAATAGNFEEIVFAAYKWLSEVYEPGDRIFMFGFSRGAFQVRIIAGMIQVVGLLHKGCQNQVPFAYEKYLLVQSNSRHGQNIVSDEENTHYISAQTFKAAVCHAHVKVHFVGCWDTVSSIGLLRGKSLPETVSGMGHVCSFRHALALDEQRVKFQPEYANGGLGPCEGDRGDVKEVWFAGTHSDVGGGNIANPTNFSPSLWWMIQEAEKRGLRFMPTEKHWEPLPLTKSLKWFWLPLEVLPIRSLSYKNEDSSTWRPHLCSGRRVQPGQRIHHTVFTRRQTMDRPYHPKATPPSNFRDWESFFEKCELSQDNPIFEFDPFENAAAFLASLVSAIETLSTNSSSPEAVTQYAQSMLGLRSYLGAHASRQTSLNELPNVEKVLLSALELSLQPQKTTASINTHDLKETLVQLLAAVKLTRSNDAHGTKASDIRRWMGRVTAKRKPDLAVVLNHFACISQQKYNRWIKHVAFSHLDPTKVILLLTSSTDGTTSILIWDGSSQPPKEIAKVNGERLTISRDGSHIAVGDGEDVSIIDTTQQPPSVLQYTDYEDSNDSGDIVSRCFSTDNHTLATGHRNGWIKLWQREGDQWKVGRRFKGGYMSYRLAFSRDGSRLGFDAQPIKVWDLADNTVIELEDSGNSVSLVWSPSGDQIISGTWDGRVKIWSADRGKITHTFKAHDDTIRCLAFRDDGQVLATGSYDNRIRIWQWDTWEKIWECDIGEDVESLAFSPDGKRFVSGGEYGAVHLWDVDMGDDEHVD